MTTSLTAARRLCLIAVTGAALIVSACGGNDSSSSSSGKNNSGDSGGGYYGASPKKTTTTASAAAGGLALKADESAGLAFDRKALKAKAGTVTLTLTNPSGNSAPHAIAIEGSGIDKSGGTASPGSASTVSADLKPGTYTFYCPVDGHRAAGMEGTLTVS